MKNRNFRIEPFQENTRDRINIYYLSSKSDKAWFLFPKGNEDPVSFNDLNSYEIYINKGVYAHRSLLLDKIIYYIEKKHQVFIIHDQIDNDTVKTVGFFFVRYENEPLPYGKYIFIETIKIAEEYIVYKDELYQWLIKAISKLSFSKSYNTIQLQPDLLDIDTQLFLNEGYEVLLKNHPITIDCQKIYAKIVPLVKNSAGDIYDEFTKKTLVSSHIKPAQLIWEESQFLGLPSIFRDLAGSTTMWSGNYNKLPFIIILQYRSYQTLGFPELYLWIDEQSAWDPNHIYELICIAARFTRMMGYNHLKLSLPVIICNSIKEKPGISIDYNKTIPWLSKQL